MGDGMAAKRNKQKNESSIKHICAPNDYLFPYLVQCISTKHTHSYATNAFVHIVYSYILRCDFQLHDTQRRIQHNKRSERKKIEIKSATQPASMKKKLEKIYRIYGPNYKHTLCHSFLACTHIWCL